MNLPRAVCVCYTLFLVHQFLCSFLFSRTSEVSVENLSSVVFFQVNADSNSAVLVILLQCGLNMLRVKVANHEENR